MQKNLPKIIIALLVISGLFLFFKKMKHDNSRQIEQTENLAPVANKLPQDFHDFYNAFHTDSIYQMKHIIFPLKGLGKSQDTTKVAEEKIWQRDDWKLHRAFNDFNGTYEREFTHIEGIISEVIIGNGGMFSMEKRYAKINNDWHLIFYQELLMAR